MKGAFNNKIKYIIFISFITAVLVFASFSYIFGFRFVLEKDNRVYFNEVAIEAAKMFESRLDAILTSLESNTYIFEYAHTLSPPERARALIPLIETTQFKELLFIDMDGLAVSARHDGTANLSYRNYFRSAAAGTKNISGTVVSVFDGNSTNVFAVPVYSSADNKIVGVLAGGVGDDYIKDLMASETFQGKALSYITDSTGEIMLAPAEDTIGFNAGTSIFNNEKVSITASDGIDEITNNLRSGEAEGNFTFNIENESYLASYKKVNIGDWNVFTLARTSDVHDVTSNIFFMMFAFTMTFLAITAGGVVIFGVRYWITSKKHLATAEERDYFKYSDTLTGGPSFDKFLEDVHDVFDRADSSIDNYAMISMDINKFRSVNDHLGHEEGDKILIRLSEVVSRNLNIGEVYSRKNADLFYMLIKYEEDADIFARINTVINDAYYQIEEFKLILLFGIYKIDDLEMDIRSIIDRADLARRTIKNSNESSFAFFDNKMLSKIREEKKIENIMENALESNEFKVYLQPKYDLQERKEIIGAEALIRWFRDGKMIPPGGFIPIFEKNGFILRVDRFVFEEVCKQQKIWLSRGYDMRVISVNMSRINLQQPNFVRDLYDICTKYNVPTKYFEIEITESVAFENLEVLTRVFNELKNYGFHISIDDFGTGYSSLNMLKNLPVDVLKLDRAFISDSGKNERANSIVSHVIQLALSLHMKTICEGIETIEQVKLLSDLGCDMAQGFYFARPMPITDYEKLLYGEAESKITI